MAARFDGLCKKPLERWSTDLAERLTTIFAHVRRLRLSEIRFRQATCNMDNPNTEKLRDLLSQVTIQKVIKREPPHNLVASAPSAAQPLQAPAEEASKDDLPGDDSLEMPHEAIPDIFRTPPTEPDCDSDTGLPGTPRRRMNTKTSPDTTPAKEDPYFVQACPMDVIADEDTSIEQSRPSVLAEEETSIEHSRPGIAEEETAIEQSRPSSCAEQEEEEEEEKKSDSPGRAEEPDIGKNKPDSSGSAGEPGIGKAKSNFSASAGKASNGESDLDADLRSSDSAPARKRPASNAQSTTPEKADAAKADATPPKVARTSNEAVSSLRLTHGEAKTYITWIPAGEQKKTLLVNCTENQSKDHKKVMDIILKEMTNYSGFDKMSKDAAKEIAMSLRDALIS